ncbi:MFS transporter [Labrenzia sp. VG12]|uniref:MFS transporter n=1 Tax=Labrenzia sp. VG12 TaxID=2021862 RepID=UPI000B8C4094|nr:MFS transporter [Labrenzia sp. VG12]ASP32552.1 MFS transporter [Labrenzia sp. VG12]
MSSQTHVSGRPIWLEAAAIALLLIATLKIMANATISPALPGLEASFADSPQAAYLTRFLVAAPSLSVVLIAPFAGLAADRFGRAPLLIAGVVLFAVSGSAGAYLPDLSSILVSRLLLGVAVALTMTAQVALVGDLFDGERRSAFLGLQTAAINFSGFLFISLAGGLAGLSPRLPFLIYALPALLLPLLLVVLRQERRSRIASQIAAAPVPAASEKSWWLPSLGVAVLTMLTVMLFFLMPSQLPFYLEENGLDGALGTAFGLGALTLTAGCVAMAFKRISARLGLAMTFGLGFAMMATGFATLSLGASWGLILAGAAQVGAGYALVQPALFMLALHLVPESRRGRVSGMVTTAMFLGQVVSPLLLTPLLDLSGFEWLFRAVAAGFAVACLSASVIAWFKRRRPPARSKWQTARG